MNKAQSKDNKGVVIKSRFKGKDKVLLSYNDSPTHNLVIGTTGSGKTQSYILPSILALGKGDNSMVINDPKGELYQKTANYLKENGYSVYLMDYFEPLSGSSFNQLFMVESEYDKGLPHLYKAKAINAILKTVSFILSDSKVNPFSFFDIDTYSGSKASMPVSLQKDLVKGRYITGVNGYTILRICKPKENRNISFNIKTSDELIELLKKIFIEVNEKILENYNSDSNRQLEELLHHNDYLYFREKKVLEAVGQILEELNINEISNYIKEKIKDNNEILDKSNKDSSSYESAKENISNYQKILEDINTDGLSNDTLIFYLKSKEEDHRNIFIDHETRAINEAGSIASMLVGKSNNSDKFWDLTAISLQKALILFVCKESHLPFSKHLSSVNNILSNLTAADSNSDKSKLDFIFDRLSDLDIVKLASSEVRLAPEKTKGSILASAGVATEIFSDYGVADQSSRNDFDPEILAKKKTAVFLVSPGNDDAGTAQYTILSTLFIEEVYSSLNRLLSKTKEMTLKRPVYFLLDELANIPPIPELGSKISLARSKNIRFSLVIQSYEQLKSHYKESYDTIRENSNILYILSNNTGTAKEISERIGKTTIEVNSVSSSFKDKNAGSSSISTAGRDLFTPQEIMQMKEGSALYMMQRNHPYLTHLEPVYKWPIYDWLKDNSIDNIHVRRNRQKVNYFCPEPNEFVLAYESLDKNVILDRYIYKLLTNDLSEKEDNKKDDIISIDIKKDDKGEYYQYIILEDGTKQKIIL